MNLGKILNQKRTMPKRAGSAEKEATSLPARFCLFLSQDEKEKMDAFIEQSRLFDKNLKYSKAYILREGARRFIRYEQQQMRLAKKGALHVKIREPQNLRLPLKRS